MELINLVTLIKYIGVFIAFLSLSSIGLGFILKSKIPKERESLMKGLLNVAIGTFIVGSTLSIVGFIISSQDTLSTTVTNQQIPTPSYKYEGKDTSNFILKGIASIFDAFTGFVFGNNSNDGWGKIFGFESMDSLFYNKGNSNIIIQPFTNSEWNAINILYKILAVLSVPLIIIMVGKSGISYIYNAQNHQKLQETKEDIQRWIFVLVISTAGLLMARAIFEFTGYLSRLLYDQLSKYGYAGTGSFAFDTGIVNTIQTGNVLTTAIVKFMYACLYLKINMAFLARKWVLIVMTAATPLVAALWGINKKVQAFDVWMGEILTNAVMGLTYGITFAALRIVIADPKTNVLFSMLGMYMAIKIAEVLRNLLQGLITKHSGINEMQEGLSGLTVAGSILGGMFGAFGASGVNMGLLSGGLTNAFKTLTASSTALDDGGSSGHSKLISPSGGINGSSVNSTPVPMNNPLDTFSKTYSKEDRPGFVDENYSEVNDEENTTTPTSSSPKTLQQLAAYQKNDNSNISDLINNYNKHNNTSRTANKLAWFATSGDSQLAPFAKGLSTAIGGVMNGFNMARAIWETTGQIAKKDRLAKIEDGSDIDINSKISGKERMKALKTLMGRYTVGEDGNFSKDDNYVYSIIKSARIVGSTIHNNNNKTERLLMKDHIVNAYNRNLGFNGWNDLAESSPKS